MTSALVLSAGGMFGAYQAGVWKSLARVFQPDLVVGTSAGSLNGWAIAGGCSVEELTAIWLDPALEKLMRVRWRASMWQGLWDPAPLAESVVASAVGCWACEYEANAKQRPAIAHAVKLGRLLFMARICRICQRFAL